MSWQAAYLRVRHKSYVSVSWLASNMPLAPPRNVTPLRALASEMAILVSKSARWLKRQCPSFFLRPRPRGVRKRNDYSRESLHWRLEISLRNGCERTGGFSFNVNKNESPWRREWPVIEALKMHIIFSWQSSAAAVSISKPHK